jgi:hypothetical protein
MARVDAIESLRSSRIARILRLQGVDGRDRWHTPTARPTIPATRRSVAQRLCRAVAMHVSRAGGRPMSSSNSVASRGLIGLHGIVEFASKA